MMLNDFAITQRFESIRGDDRNRNAVQMNSTSYSNSEIESSAHQDNSSSNAINGNINSNNSTSSSSKSDQQVGDHTHQQQQQFNQQHHQNHADQQHHSHYFTSTNTSAELHNSGYNKFNPVTTTNSLTSLSIDSIFNTTNLRTDSSVGDMNVNSNQHTNMIPTAHGSDHQILYSQPTPKNLPVSSPNLALNFSHDLLHQSTSHHTLTSGVMSQHSDNNSDVKPQLQSSFELDSRLMQSAANMNMWKDMNQLTHFKRPVSIHEHNFLPSSDLNSFPGWTHGNNLNHQSSGMSHNILDSQHLIGYSQHQQRPIPISHQDLGGSVVKNQQTVDQTSFMFNSINHKASTSQNSSSNHQTTQPLDNLSLRSDSLDHNTSSHNLSINDNHLYTSSRSENRSHLNIGKSSFMSDRSVHMSLGNHQGLSYHHSNENVTLQHIPHIVAGSSSGSTKNAGSFRCPHCHEVFPLRTVYQSHLKTHSQEKGSKAKFQCDLCGHSFSQKTSLNRHMKSHTGERPFPCEICAKAFSEKERLKIHMRTHTGEKPFSCQVCGKSFSQKSTVKRHQTVHTGEKKFRCDCGKGFANRGNLIAHIKTRGSNHFE